MHVGTSPKLSELLRNGDDGYLNYFINPSSWMALFKCKATYIPVGITDEFIEKTLLTTWYDENVIVESWMMEVDYRDLLEHPNLLDEIAEDDCPDGYFLKLFNMYMMPNPFIADTLDFDIYDIHHRIQWLSEPHPEIEGKLGWSPLWSLRERQQEWLASTGRKTLPRYVPSSENKTDQD